MKYREESRATEPYRIKFRDGIEKIIEDKQREAEESRKKYFHDYFSKPEEYREDFKKMLGWPLCCERPTTEPKVNTKKLAEEEICTIYRMSFEVLEGLEMTGLFFEKDTGKKMPFIIAQHGAGGTPEGIAGLYDGDTKNYNDMDERVLKCGANVFAPQTLRWSVEDENVPFDRNATDARLKRVGSSIAAIELYGMMRILDYFEKQDYVSSFGMVGLSYGGFCTLFLAAVDDRIKSAIACASFNDRDKYARADWSWNKSAHKFSDAEVACMVYPRRLCIEVGIHDTLFSYAYAEKEIERLRTLNKFTDMKWLDIIAFAGEHEFCKDDLPVERMINDLTKN